MPNIHTSEQMNLTSAKRDVRRLTMVSKLTASET